MKFKKFVAAASAVTMLGAMLTAVPAGAAENEKVYPTAGVYLRVNGNGIVNSKYADLDVTNTTEEATVKYEMQWTNGFAAVYKFNIGEYKNDTDVSVKITTNDNAYTIYAYSALPENNNDAGKALYGYMTTDPAPTAISGTGSKERTLDWNTLINSADSDGNVYLLFTRLDSGKWEKYIDKKETPYLTVNSTPAQIPETAIAEKNGEYIYDAEALTNALCAGGTINLLNNPDVTLTARVLTENAASDLTIIGPGTLTGVASQKFAMEAYKHSITLDNVTIKDNAKTQSPYCTVNVKSKSVILKNSASVTSIKLSNNAAADIQSGSVGTIETAAYTTPGSSSTVTIADGAAVDTLKYDDADTITGTATNMLMPVIPASATIEKIYDSSTDTTANLEGEASAWLLNVTAGTSSIKVAPKVNGADPTNAPTDEDATIMTGGNAVFGILINKVVDASAITMDGVEITAK